MRTFFTLLTVILMSSPLLSQDLGQIRKQMQPIPGGECLIGGGYSYTLRGASMKYIAPPNFDESLADELLLGEVPPENTPTMKVQVTPFFLSSHEVTNLEYRQYLVDLVLNEAEEKAFWQKLQRLEKEDAEMTKRHWAKLFEKAESMGALPDSYCWTADFPFSSNQPLADNYLWHRAFDNYPVVGTTWQQARDYCAWLTGVNNAERAKRGLSDAAPFRLPTETEWEYAAKGAVKSTEDKPRSQAIYPWAGTQLQDDKGDYHANIKPEHRNYIADGYEYTAPVGSFAANEFGLHDMAGNVAEWTEKHSVIDVPGNEYGPVMPSDPLLSKVTKGGSWADYKYAAMVGSRCFVAPNQGYSRVGFRVAQSR